MSLDNTTTLGFSVLPPDTQGDVGSTYYVQWVNLVFAVYDKVTGTIAPGGGPFAGNSLWAGFTGPCEANNDGDPIVLYDHLAGRWLLSQFSIDEGTQCVALSQTGDPLGTYDRWAFVVSPGQGNDYPKIGLMPGAYYLSTRDFPSGSMNFAGFVAMDRAAMLAGDPNAGFVKFGLPCDSANNNCTRFRKTPVKPRPNSMQWSFLMMWLSFQMRMIATASTDSPCFSLEGSLWLS